MSLTNTTTGTSPFTVTHAKHLSAKVATDLKRMQRLYDAGANGLSDRMIEEFECELIEYLMAGYLGSVKYGFFRNNSWIYPSLHYTARELLQAMAIDDSPGKVYPGADVTGASFGSYLTFSQMWTRSSPEAKRKFRARLPFQRISGEDFAAGGIWVKDRIYSANGQALSRSSLAR